MSENLKKYLVEFIGTFFLVFTIGAIAAFGENLSIAPLAIGFVLMVMVYAGGYVSGGHYNPAVSLAAVIRGALPLKQLVPYTLAQLAGALISALLIILISGNLAPQAKATFNLWTIFIAEFLFTFALCYVVLHTATSRKTQGNSYYGLAIGSTVMVGAFAVGNICLGAFNPAVAIFSLIASNVSCPCIAYLTIAANLFAAVCAALVFKFTNIDE